MNRRRAALPALAAAVGLLLTAQAGPARADATPVAGPGSPLIPGGTVIATPAPSGGAPGATGAGTPGSGRVSVSYLVQGRTGPPHAVATVPMAPAAAQALMTRLAQQPGVLAVSRSATYHHTDAATPAAPRTLSSTRSVTTHPRATRLDPLAAGQWALSAVGARSAWRWSRGAGVLVAVVDDGVDVNHPDLRAAIVPGRNILTGGTRVDPGYHGTHVAGIIAAAADNGIGTAGLAPRVRLMPIDVFAGNDATDVTVANGIIYAASHGAQVINLSLGGTESTRVLRRSVAYAQSRGAVVVAAAGNDGTAQPEFPAAYAGVVGVGAVDVSLARASFSNTGPAVDLVAPGVNILSTTCLVSRRGVCRSHGYVRMSGTSMAAPYVSAAAALLLARFPRWSAARVVSELEQTATDLGRSGRDDSYGHGLIAPATVLAGAPGAVRQVATSSTDVASGTATFTWAAPRTVGGYGVGSYRAELSLDGGLTWPRRLDVPATATSVSFSRIPAGSLLRGRVTAVARRTLVAGPAALTRTRWYGIDAADSPASAARLVWGTPVRDVLSSDEDQDWYRLPDHPLVDPITFTVALTGRQPGMTLVLRDEQGEPVTIAPTTSGGTLSFTVTVPAGDYVVAVRSSGLVDPLAPYTLVATT